MATQQKYNASTYTSEFTPRNWSINQAPSEKPIRFDVNMGSGYIKNYSLRETKIIYIASTPESVSEDISVNSTTEAPIGAAQPYIIYTSTGARQVSLSFAVSADYLPDGYNNLIDYVRDIKQICYPYYNGSNITPPKCEFYINKMHILGMPQSVNVTWGSTFKKGFYDYATVNIAIQETETILEGKVFM